MVRLARQVGGEGFVNMKPEELDDLIASIAEELTKEELNANIKVSEEVSRSKLTV